MKSSRGQRFWIQSINSQYAFHKANELGMHVYCVSKYGRHVTRRLSRRRDFVIEDLIK